MSKNQFSRHRKANKRLGEIIDKSEQVLVIHYSCESFYDISDGRSPRITSIAIRNLESGQTESFSIHQLAEMRGVSATKVDIEARYNDLEKEMLVLFYEYIKQNLSKTFLHWNMRDKNYGFQAIEHRYRVLGGDPIIVHDDRKIDLSRLLIDCYGGGYIGNPRLEKLAAHNKITMRDFLTGAQEAEAFVNGKYLDLHRSTLRKVDILCNFAIRAADNDLKTLSSWWEARGLSAATAISIFKEHPIFIGVTVLGGLAAAIVGVFNLIRLL